MVRSNSKKTLKTYAIILAGGTGERTGLSIPKQFIKIAGKTVLEHTIAIFEKHKKINEIIVVTNGNYVDTVTKLVQYNNYKKITKILIGGSTRQESSFIGISSISETDAKVLIHDAVRPFLNPQIISECIKALKTYNAVDVAVSSYDTIIRVNKNIIEDIPKRKYLKRGQTPQGFDLKTIRKAHELALNEPNIEITDDCGLVLYFNLCEIYVISLAPEEGDNNMKITSALDVSIADKLFQLKTAKIELTPLNLLKDKVIVIFGASKGIGKSIFEISNFYGAKVYGCSRSSNISVTNFKQVANFLKDTYKKEGKIDAVINTAGLLNMGNLINRSITDIKFEIETNYIGCINVAKASFDYLCKSKGSLLFFTSSSYTRGRAMYSIYSSTKAAVVNLTQAIAEEWDNFGIRVNVCAPARTSTPMRFENFGKEPAETLLSPQKVAEISLNLILSKYTGQIVCVNKNQD